MGLLPPRPRGEPEVLHLALKAFNLLAPPQSQCLDILGKTRPAEAASGASSLLTHLTSTLPI